MLQMENGQLTINQAAYQNLVTAQLMKFKAKLNNAAAAEIDALAKDRAKKATDNNAEASDNAVAGLDAETEALKRNALAAGDNAIAKAVAEAEAAGVPETPDTIRRTRKIIKNSRNYEDSPQVFLIYKNLIQKKEAAISGYGQNYTNK